MPDKRATLMDPPIESLLDKVDSKFTLVALGSLRARQVNAYYNSLGEGLGRVVPPQVTSISGKPLSIAFEEIAAGKATYERFDPEEEALLAEQAAAHDAEAANLASGDGAMTPEGGFLLGSKWISDPGSAGEDSVTGADADEASPAIDEDEGPAAS